MNIHEQGTDEWHAARIGHFTASRFADLLVKTKNGTSVTREKYIKQIAIERLVGERTEFFETPAMAQGTAREPSARRRYEESMLEIVEEVGFIKHSALMCGASPDGLVGLKGGIEIKCPQPMAHLDYLLLDKEPDIYTAQIQGCMWITGRDWWDFVSYNPEFPPELQLKIVRVFRDNEFIKKLEHEIEKANDDAIKILEKINNKETTSW